MAHIRTSVFFLFAFLLETLGAQAQRPATMQDTNRLPAPSTFTYAVHERESLKMDVYQPTKRRDDSATVIYVFGGGFADGSRNDGIALEACKALIKKGYIAVSIDYRQGLRYTDFDTVKLRNSFDIFNRCANWAAEDLCTAINYLCQHAPELGILTHRIVLTGASAGAIAVLQADYARCNNMATASMLPTGWKPMAVVSYSGAILTTNGRPRYATAPAPTCFFHGTIDRIVNYNSFPSLPLRKKMWGSNKVAPIFQKNHYPHWFLSYEGNGHEVNHALPETIEIFDLYVKSIVNGDSTFCNATCHTSRIKTDKYSRSTIFDLYRM